MNQASASRTGDMKTHLNAGGVYAALMLLDNPTSTHTAHTSM
jgi:hypothetical protein